MKRTNHVFALFILSVGCTDEGADPAEAVNTVLSGRAAFDGPVPGGLVEVFDFQGGVKGGLAEATEAGDSGEWSVELGPLDGDLLVEVVLDEGAGVRMSTMVESVRLGEIKEGIQVTPVTTFAHAYTRFLMGMMALPFEEAKEKARGAIYGHFGGLDHEQVWAKPMKSWDGNLTESVVGGVLLGSLLQQAKEMNIVGGASDRTSLLVDRYVKDIEHYGIFDGKGPAGEQLRFGNVDLHGDSLRLELSWSIENLLGSPRNESGLTVDDFKYLIDAIAENDSEIFPKRAVEERDRTPPSVLEVGLFDIAGEELEWEHLPVKGQVFVKLVAEDEESGVDGVELSGTASAAVGGDMVPSAEELKAQVNTRILQDGMHSLVLSVKDVARNRRDVELLFGVDNRAPTVTATMAQQIASDEMAIFGEWADEGLWPVDVAVLVGGVEQRRWNDAPSSFEVEASVPCNGTRTDVSVVAIDSAGNESAPATEWVLCDSDGPEVVILPTSMVQERDLELNLVSGQGQASVDYAVPFGARELRIDNVSTRVDTVGRRAKISSTIEKYFNRLDVNSENLPVVRFRALDQVGVERASYRYLVDGVERRSWEELQVDPSGEFELPLSYQTLGLELIAGESVEQVVEVKVENGVGLETVRTVEFQLEPLSPPVWLQECQVAGALDWGQLRNAFDGSNAEMVQAKMWFLLGLEAGSLAPTDGVEISLSTTDAQAKVTALTGVKFYHPRMLQEFQVANYPAYDSGFSCPRVYNCYETITQEQAVGGANLYCVGGVRSSEYLSLVNGFNMPGFESRLGGANDFSTAVSAAGAGGTLLDLGAGVKFLPAEFETTLKILSVNARLEVEGLTYLWPVQPEGVAAEFVTDSNVVGRYWLPSSMGLDGLEIDRTVTRDAWQTCYPTVQTMGYRPVSTRMALRELEITVPRIEVTTYHSSLSVEVPVERAPGCESATVFSFSE